MQIWSLGCRQKLPWKPARLYAYTSTGSFYFVFSSSSRTPSFRSLRNTLIKYQISASPIKVKGMDMTVVKFLIIVSAATPVAFSISRKATGIAKHSTIHTSLKGAPGSSSCLRFLLVNSAPVATLEVTEVAMFKNSRIRNPAIKNIGAGRWLMMSEMTPDCPISPIIVE